MSRILLVEDLQEYQILVKRALNNFEVHIVGTCREALITLKDEPPFDLIILDSSLPDGEGLYILEQIHHRFGDTVPVFFLTSNMNLDAKITAFHLGAEDYLIKPITGAELRARVEMRLKKNQKQKTMATKLVKGALTLDLALLRANIQEGSNSNALPLTAKEFKILALLAQNENQVFSRQELVEHIWGPDVHIQQRTVDSHIFGLRRKLGTHAAAVECIPHVGYRFKY